MKFRYKVLICNILCLSLGLGIAGYFMIQRNFRLAIDTQIGNGITNNNIVQASVENELLREIYDGALTKNLMLEKLQEIGRQIVSSMPEENSRLYIRYSDQMAYGDEKKNKVLSNLFQNLEVGDKQYVLGAEGNSEILYVTSCSEIDGNRLCVVSCTDVTEVYELMETQTAYFRVISIVILVIVSGIVYFISRILTSPLEKLAAGSDEIAKGHYDCRVEVVSRDEVGQVSERFNGMAEAVQDHIGQLEEMIHRRDQFVADFTHELKTPMTSIIGYADTMRSVELTEDEKMMALNYIFSEGKRLEGLSSKLFDLIYLRQNEIPMEELNAKNIIREVEKSMAPRLEQDGIALEIHVDDGVIFGNRELMMTVFINLLDNARKASEHGGKVIVSGRKRNGPENNRYEFIVKDFGIGMTEEVARHMCDEFYMADKSRARKAGGAGLGMSIVADILKRHGAQMEVKSVVGEGTEIYLFFETICE